MTSADEVHRQAEVGLLKGGVTLADDVGEEDGDEGSRPEEDGAQADDPEALFGG